VLKFEPLKTSGAVTSVTMRVLFLVFVLAAQQPAWAAAATAAAPENGAEACEETSMLQVKALQNETKTAPPLPKSQRSEQSSLSWDRVLNVFKSQARLWNLDRRHLVKLSEEQRPSFSETDAVTDASHDQYEIEWLTMIPCIVIGVAITAFLVTFAFQNLQGEAAKPVEAIEEVKGMTEMQMLFNMVQNIVGEGMLSLPAGIAGGTGLFAGSLIAFFVCSLMGYTFSIMGRTCHATGEKTHKDCGQKVMGPKMAQTMAIILMLKTIFTCLTYAIVIGESFSRILAAFGVQGLFSTSQAVLIGISLCILLPLCLQRDLSILSYTSMIGICGQVWVVLFMQIRYMDKSYTPGGIYYEQIEARDRPSFGDGGVLYWKTSAATFVLLGSLSTAFIAHYNAPKFYSQLRDATPARFNRVVAGAFGFSMVIYFWIMSVGYLTFGKAAEGLILNNYSEHDPLATSARIAIGFAVTFGFPFGFTGLRDSTMSVFEMGSDKFVPVTLTLLTFITTMGCFFHDLGLANSLGGAVFGALITLIFPGLLCWCAGTTPGITEFSPFESKYVAFLVIALGVSLLVFGSVLVVITRYFPEVIHGH